MDKDFLRKEEQLRKENKQLELRTKELLQKVDDIKKMQDLQLRDVPFKLEPNHIEPKDLNLPKSVDEMGSKGMVHFYKSKVKSLHENLEKTQLELAYKNEELKKLQRNYQTVSEEKEKWFLQYNDQKNFNSKLEKQITACNSKLQLKETENATLKKEIEQLKTEVKALSNELAASEGRFKRAAQDVDKHKTTIKSLRDEEKETKEMYKNNLKDLNNSVKQIQKHKNELLQGYKKQMQLIDNLKRQKAHIESCKVLELAESEFFKLLDWKVND